MSKQTRAGHPIYNLLLTEIEGFDSLAELALHMRWSWNHATNEVWRQLDPELWEITNNPWVALRRVSRDRILNDLDPNAVRVELYADGINGGDPVREEMKYERPLPDASHCGLYHARLPNPRLAKD
jgi:hypothetical protein